MIIDKILKFDVKLSISEFIFDRLEVLSNDYTEYKENSISYITNINNDIDNLNTNIDNNFVNNTTLSTLSTAIDEQFELTLLLKT